MGQHGGPRIHNEAIVLNIDVSNTKSYSTGTTVYGLLGRNSGTLSNVSIVGTGSTKSFSLNGSTSTINLGSGVGLNLTGSITISTWINPASFGGNSRGRIFDKLSETFPYGGYALYVDNINASSAFAYGIGVLVGNTVSYQQNRVTLNTWQHIATVHSGTNVIFYKDGSAIGSSTTSVNLTTAQNVTIGNNVGGTRGFDGLISDVKVYNSALSASEIKNIYNSQRKRYGL